MKKYVKRAAMAIIMLIAFTVSTTAGNEKPINVSQLPAKAHQLLNRHFGNKKVAMAKVESGFFSKEYTVIFTNGENTSRRIIRDVSFLKLKKTTTNMRLT